MYKFIVSEAHFHADTIGASTSVIVRKTAKLFKFLYSPTQRGPTIVALFLPMPFTRASNLHNVSGSDERLHVWAEMSATNCSIIKQLAETHWQKQSWGSLCLPSVLMAEIHDLVCSSGTTRVITSLQLLCHFLKVKRHTPFQHWTLCWPSTLKITLISSFITVC